MILKASQRGGGKQLALHLLKTEENEHVEVHEVKGFVSDDIIGAMKEAYAVSKGTKCKQFLFSVSLNPPPNERVEIGLFEETLGRIEEETGLTDHPRVVVFHEKEGRRHCHAVWSRIDAEQMKAVNLSHFKLKLREISRGLYHENNWKMPRGLMNSGERDPRNFTLDQWQQAKRSGWNAGDLKTAIQDCWAVSDSKAAFEQALKLRGMTLAKGDRRGHVAVLHDGTVLSIARYTEKHAKAVRTKLGEADSLPGVEDAKAQIAREMTPALQRLLQEARRRKECSLAPLDAQRLAMIQHHRLEREGLESALKRRWSEETRERALRLKTGVRGLWQRITGERARIIDDNVATAYKAIQRDCMQRETLRASQHKERQILQRQIHEVRSQHADLFKDLRAEKARYADLAKSGAPPMQRHFETQKNIVERQATPRIQPDTRNARSEAPALTQSLNKLRRPEHPQTLLKEKFARIAEATTQIQSLASSAPKTPTTPPDPTERLERLRAQTPRPTPSRPRTPDHER